MKDMKTPGKTDIDMNEENREDIIRAKQAISPDGLEDQSADGGVSSEITPKPLPDNKLEDKYMDGDELAEGVRTNNPNRNPNPKPDIDKPAYT